MNYSASQICLAVGGYQQELLSVLESDWRKNSGAAKLRYFIDQKAESECQVVSLLP